MTLAKHLRKFGEFVFLPEEMRHIEPDFPDLYLRLSPVGTTVRLAVINEENKIIKDGYLNHEGFESLSRLFEKMWKEEI